MFSIPKINLGKIADFKILGIPWWLIVLVFGWVYYTAYERGKMHEELKNIQHKIDSTSQIVGGLRDSIKVRDAAIVELLARVEAAKVKVITVDKTVQPKIDSAIAALEQNLDSTNRARLKVIVDGFEAKVASRDSLIQDQAKVIAAQDSTIKFRDRVIELQLGINKDLQKMYKEKKTGLTLPQKIAGIVITGLAIYGMSK